MLVKSFVTWCNDNHLMLNIRKITEFRVDHNDPNMDLAAKDLQILKCGFYICIFKATAQNFYTTITLLSVMCQKLSQTKWEIGHNLPFLF